MGKSSNGSNLIPRLRARLGKSKPGPLSWRSEDRTATRKPSIFLTNMSGNSARPARTSKLGLKQLNSMTMPVLEEKRKSQIHTNNEEQIRKNKKRQSIMRAMRAEQFNGYNELKLVNLPKPAVTDGKVLVRITAAGVTPLDHTILSGKFHGSKAPVGLGNEGAGGVGEGGGTGVSGGAGRVVFRRSAG